MVDIVAEPAVSILNDDGGPTRRNGCLQVFADAAAARRMNALSLQKTPWKTAPEAFTVADLAVIAAELTGCEVRHVTVLTTDGGRLR